MDAETKAELFKQGGRALSALLRVQLSRSGKKTEETQEVIEVVSAAPVKVETPKPAARTGLPTTEETVRELKRRLARELYKAELDLSAGLKIAGKPCDCLSEKHTLLLEAATEELISQDPSNPVYHDIMVWVKTNQAKINPQAIESGQFSREYPAMAAEFRDFRKRVMGTTSSAARPAVSHDLSLEEAQSIAAKQAAEEVAKRWDLLEKK
jgi:hypothetical protein